MDGGPEAKLTIKSQLFVGQRIGLCARSLLSLFLFSTARIIYLSCDVCFHPKIAQM